MGSVVNRDFDDILNKIAEALYKNEDIDRLRKALGFGTRDIGRKIDENSKQGGNSMGTLDLLRTWRNRQTPSTENAALREALFKAGFDNLADKYLSTPVTVTTKSFPSSPNTITSTSNATTAPTSAAASTPTTTTQKAFLVLTILTAVTVSGTTQVLSTTTGDTVNIPCLFGEGTLSSIFWFYKDGTGRHKILSFADWGLTIDPEYASRTSLQDDHSTLILKGITVADEGTYRCDVDRQGQTVVSNINTKLNVFSLRPGTLPVITPCIGADETSLCSIHANQSFTVTCTLPNVYPFEDTELIWYQGGQRFSSTYDVTQNDDGTTDISRQIHVFETGNFTCNATYLSANGRENTAVSVEALIIPLSHVPNTPGKYLTDGQIVGMTVVLIGFFLVFNILFLCRLKARGKFGLDVKDKGQRSCREETQLYPVTSTEELKLPGISTEIDYKDGNAESSEPAERPTINRSKHEEEELNLLWTSAENGSKDGNVKTSPTEKPDIDDILMDIAGKIQGDHINQLGKELGFDAAEIERYVATNSRYINVTCGGTLAMLRDWDEKQFKARERAALNKALMDTGLVRLADDVFSEESSVENSTLPQSSTVRHRNVNRKISDGMLCKLARYVPTYAYEIFSEKLGIEHNQARNILDKYNNDYEQATMECIAKWMNRSTRTVPDLHEALIEAELGGLIVHCY